MKSMVMAIVIALGTSFSGSVAIADPEGGHPNIIAARDDIARAMDKVKAAQAANHDDMDGHAAKALDLLAQAEHELKLAAEAANRHK